MLSMSSDYFDKLFNFDSNKNKSTFDIVVPNAIISNDIILSFYDPKYINLNNYDWKNLLDYYKCKHFFCLDNDYALLEKMIVPPTEINSN